MGFQLKIHKGFQTGLEAVCDVCGKQLEAGMANLLWLPNDGREGTDKEGDVLFFRLAHKGVCTHMIDNLYGKQYWQELDTALIYLMKNIKMDYEKALESAIVLSQIGL